MNCDELREHYELFAMDLLEDASLRAELEAHLARRCPHCTAGVRGAREAFSLLALTVRPATPPAELREKIIAAVRTSKSGNVVAMPPVAAAKRAPVWQKVLPWAAAAGLLMGLGYYRQAEQARTEELVTVRVAMQHLENSRKLELAELERLRPLADFLRQADTRVVTFGEPTKTPPRGRVLVNPGRGVLLLANSLPALTPGQTFQMWVIPKAGAPQPAGLFQAAEGAAVHVRAGAVDLAQAAAIAVSVEPESGSPAPTTTPILIAPLAGL